MFRTAAPIGEPDRRRGRRVVARAGVVVVAMAMALMGGIVSAPAVVAEPLAADTTESCLAYLETGELDCYADNRAAMAALSGGRYTDAPLRPADMTKADFGRVNKGNRAAARGVDGAAVAAGTVLAIAYSGRNLTSSALNFIGNEGNCSSGRKYSWSKMPTGWNDNFRSYQTVSNCALTWWQHNGFKGWNETWYANEKKLRLDPSHEAQFSSLKFFEGPTRKQLLNECAKSDVKCDFSRASFSEYQDGKFHEVARHDNCTPFDNQTAVRWTETTGGKVTLGVTVTASAEFDVAAMAKVSASISASVGREWNWSNTVSTTTTFEVPGWSWSALDRSPKLQQVTGSIRVTLKSGKWTRKTWDIVDFTGTVEVADHLGRTRTRGDVMTEDQIATLCADPAARVVGPKSFRSEYDLATGRAT